MADSTARQTEDVAPQDPEQNRGYGYQWWRVEEPGGTPVIAALGYGEQYLLIIPERGPGGGDDGLEYLRTGSTCLVLTCRGSAVFDGPLIYPFLVSRSALVKTRRRYR